MSKNKEKDVLSISGKELTSQNKEKEKRATELEIVNKELEKRADELDIANKELHFQNEEKEKREAELIIANKELVFQNEEKEKCAAELFIAKQALISQNKDKQIQSDVLQILNKELKAAEGNFRKLNKELEQKVIISREELEVKKKKD